MGNTGQPVADQARCDGSVFSPFCVCFPASASEKPPEFTTGATSEEEEGGRRLPPADQNVGCRPVQVAGKEGRLNDRLSPFRPSEAPPSRRSSGSDASGTAQDSAQREEEEEGKEERSESGNLQTLDPNCL